MNDIIDPVNDDPFEAYLKLQITCRRATRGIYRNHATESGHLFFIKTGMKCGTHSETISKLTTEIDLLEAVLRAYQGSFKKTQKECSHMQPVEGGIPYCEKKQTACNGCKEPEEPELALKNNFRLTHYGIKPGCCETCIQKCSTCDCLSCTQLENN